MSIKGLELSRLYYKEYGEKMLAEQFGEYKDRIAVGLAGHGSECFGFDDDISLDHDFEPGFCLWLTDEDKQKIGFKLFRAYSKLPKEFMGVKMQSTSLFGSDFKGVKSIEEFYSFYLPGGELPQTPSQWLQIPDYYLAEAINGEVFCDPLGEFSKIRNTIKNGCPEDVWLKKLASAVFHMAQAGQYNYSRCLSHGEPAAAALMLSKFAESAAHSAFLLNRRYMPYSKWSFKALEQLPILSELKAPLTELLKAPYDEGRCLSLIEEASAAVANEIRAQNLSDSKDSYLEAYAYCIKNKISDISLRNSSVIL